MTAPQDTSPVPPGRYRVSEFVRWGDIDLAGIICYGAYVRFFEIAETELFRAIGIPFSHLFDRFDFWLPRAQLHFEFRNPRCSTNASTSRSGSPTWGAPRYASSSRCSRAPRGAS
jgi:hypothetical protein